MGYPALMSEVAAGTAEEIALVSAGNIIDAGLRRNGIAFGVGAPPEDDDALQLVAAGEAVGGAFQV